MTAYDIQSGDKVAGMYHGKRFSGIVRTSRPDTYRNRQQVVHIDLDFSIDVYGEIRNSIAMNVDSTGNDPNCWTGNTKLFV